MIRLLLPLVIFVVVTQPVVLSLRRVQPLASARASMLILVLGFCTAIPLLIHLSITWLFGVPDLGWALHRVLLGGQNHAMDRSIFGLVALVFLSLSTFRALRALVLERRLRRQSSVGITVVPDKSMYAYALPGPIPKVVLSEGLICGLSRSELNVVLAHEMSHVSNRHDQWLLAGRLCALFNPFLALTMARLRLSLERIADQAAVDRYGDSEHVAHTIAKVALGQVEGRYALGIASYGTVERIKDLSRATTAPHRSASVFVGASISVLSMLMIIQWHHVLVAISAACGR